MPDSARCWLRCRSGRRIRSACVLAFASLVFGPMCVTQVVAQQPRRVGRLLVIDPCPPNNIFGVRTHDTLTKVLAERGWIQDRTWYSIVSPQADGSGILTNSPPNSSPASRR